MIKALCIALLVLLACTAPAADRMDRVPGYADDFKTNVYSGYLGTGNDSRWLHYAFVESANGANSSDPVTLWLNGGPGCSSLLGFLLEVGPYYLEDGQNYKVGDKLNENPYSWHKASHMLFFESPAGVGYSYNLDKTFNYTDASTALDSFNALLDFFAKYPEYKKNKFFIAGESYAGKYIPDLAVLIDKYNLKQKAADRVNLIAILVGNGVMSFTTLEQSTIEYIIKKEMVDPEILPLYEKYCLKDFDSDECGVFLDKYEKDTDGLNPYDIYGYCFIDQGNQQGQNRNTQTQESILLNLKEQFSRRKGPSVFKPKGLQGPPCGYFEGVSNYFNFHAKEYHAKFDGQRWNAPCAENITYIIDPKGSIESYQYLLNSSSTARKYEIVLYNGNADAVVPFIDTYKGLEMLKVLRQSTYEPWFAGDQHAGFQQQYTGILFVIFKGASHQVPQSRRQPAFQFFKNLVTNLREKPESHLSIESQ